MGIDSINDAPPPGIHERDHSDDESSLTLQIKKDLHGEEVRDRQEARRLRRVYAYLAYGLAFLWMIIMAGLLVAEGASRCFDLSDNVLIAALCSTTATIFGVPVIVTKYIFHNDTKG